MNLRKSSLLFVSLLATISLCQVLTPKTQADEIPLGSPGCASTFLTHLADIGPSRYDPLYTPGPCNNSEQAHFLGFNLVETPADFFVKYISNLLIELVVAVMVCRFIFKFKKKMIILGTAVGNLISLPVFYAVSAYFPDSYTVYVLFGEVCVWLFEAAVLYSFSKKYLSLTQVLALSAITNATTILISAVIRISELT